MRLFVAVWPAPEAVRVLQGLARPDRPTVRWTTQDQWHVTLRFLGEVAEAELPELVATIRALAAAHAPRVAVLGPVTRRLGPRTLVVPVAGLDELGGAVVDATGAIGSAPGARAFRGHLTLARARGDRSLPRQLAGQPVHSTWRVDEITLVRSRLDRAGARYETIWSAALTA